MNIRRNATRAAVLALSAGSLAVLVDGGAASAAVRAGDLTLVPATSTTTDVTADFVSTAFCPSPSTNIYVAIFGTGLPAEGDNLVGNTRLAIAPKTATGYNLPGQKSFKAVFQDASITAPTGQYSVKAICSDSSGTQNYGEFTSLVTFTPTSGPFEASYTSRVPAAATTTTLGAVTSPVTYGTASTFNATVSPTSAAGSVQFKDGATVLGSAPVSGGTASFTTSATALAAGSHSISAVFVPTDANAFETSTSASQSLTVNKAGTSTVVTTNGPSEEFSPAVFTAAVSPAVAGTVQFKVNGSNVGGPVTVSSGAAQYSTTTLAAGTYQVSAVFTPADAVNYDGSTAADTAHNVTAYAGVTESETIRATVQAGALVINVDGDKVVDLSTPTINASGDFLVATGQIDPLVVTDTRAGDPGWNVNGVVTDFVFGSTSVSKFNLGWKPGYATLAGNQQAAFVTGPEVQAGSQPTASGAPTDATIGLGRPRSLGTAPNDSGNGTARLTADLTLRLPTEVPAGTYVATLTFTAI